MANRNEIEQLRMRLSGAMTQSEVAAALGIPAATFRARRHVGDPLIEPPVLDGRGPFWLPEQVERMRSRVTPRPVGNPTFAKPRDDAAETA